MSGRVDENLTWSIAWFRSPFPIVLLLFVISLSRHVGIYWLLVIPSGGEGGGRGFG
jgi:hypothetical protein